MTKQVAFFTEFTMTLGEIRSKYLEFFKTRGHVDIGSASLVPQNDPTTLFTGSGMQPLIPYLLGQPHPQGKRLVNSQKSFRSGDIEEVGDNRHTTFFEMLGNWSLGDYFKKEQLPWFFEFLTDVVGLSPERLYVTVFAGDEKNNIPRDDESVAIWKELFAKKKIEAKDVHIGSEADGYEKGMQGGHIFYYDAKKNWWSRAGVPEKMPAGEPGGPDSEVFYDFGTAHDPKWGKECHPNCDCGRFMEIGNSVFMEYIKNSDGTFSKLPQRNVDFGGGLERIVAASENEPDVFKHNHNGLIRILENLSGKKYQENTRAFRIVADHVKAAVFLMASGVSPSNSDAGYFVRRLLRRAIRYMDVLSGGKQGLDTMVVAVSNMYSDVYPEVKNIHQIEEEIQREELQFRVSLNLGLKMFNKISAKDVSGEEAFLLFSTYGFPIEMTTELAQERGMTVDERGFEKLKKQHQNLSRAGSEQKFKGGLADSHEKTVKLHTAHHLLLRALQVVLGEEVKQRGSNITQERLRIDFSTPSKMTKEQLTEVERIVNEKMEEDLPVIHSEMGKEDAEKLGAEQEFGQKYGERVSVYSVGPKDATVDNPQFEKRFSIEFCGGPHVTHTGALKEEGKKFKIQKEEAVAAGVRRIKAVLE